MRAASRVSSVGLQSMCGRMSALCSYLGNQCVVLHLFSIVVWYRTVQYSTVLYLGNQCVMLHLFPRLHGAHLLRAAGSKGEDAWYPKKECW